MVKQQQRGKTSSTGPSEYRVRRGVVVQIAWLPETANITCHRDGPNSSFEISGTLSKDTTEECWPEPPHVMFANLGAGDSRAVEAFIKRYGILHWNGPLGSLAKESNVGTREDILRTRDRNQQQLAGQIENALRGPFRSSNRHFSIESFGLFLDQDHLRDVWEDAEPVEELEAQIVAGIVVKQDTVELVPEDLWALI